MEKQQSFLDKQTFIAFIVIFVAWMGWERHMRRKYPPQKPPAPTVSQTEKSQETLVPKKKLQEKAPLPEKLFTLEDSEWRVVISSQGAGVKNVYLKNHFNEEKQNIRFVPHIDSQKGFFHALVDNDVLNFDLKQVSPHKLQGVARKDDQDIQVEINVFPFFLEYQYQFNPQKESSFEVETSVLPLKKDSQGFFKSALSGGRRQLSFFAKDFDQAQHIFYSKKIEQVSLDEVIVFGLGTRYFGQSFVNESSLIPQLEFKGQAHQWKTQVRYQFSQNTKVSEIKYRVFFGPKSYRHLSQVHPDLHEWVNFGFLRYFSEIILWFLGFLFSFTQNWGFSIILMTLVIRALLLPLNRFSYKSMQVMKKLQPEIKKMRAKYKDDMRKMNVEIMDLMKKNNARPFASYLPLLIQLPIFFALYRVLSESFELYQAPFFGWIQDLSSKDPFFILPVLMGGAMFFQQKLTPMNLEPAQEKVLRFLPILFTFFMLNLPSGLTLYIFVSTLFGLIQQIYLDKTLKTPQK